MLSNKYIKLAEKYMDNVARHYDPVPQESAIIDFAIWLDKQATEHSVQRTGLTCAHLNVDLISGVCWECHKVVPFQPRR